LSVGRALIASSAKRRKEKKKTCYHRQAGGADVAPEEQPCTSGGGRCEREMRRGEIVNSSIFRKESTVQFPESLGRGGSLLVEYWMAGSCQSGLDKWEEGNSGRERGLLKVEAGGEKSAIPKKKPREDRGRGGRRTILGTFESR